MRPWYRNSTLQMDDAEMEYLQSQDCAACAVWEWLKADCQKRGTPCIRELSEVEKTTISRRLGIDSPRFSQISHFLQALGWITPEGEIRGWQKWQGTRTPEEDALRKQVEYWKRKAGSGNGLHDECELNKTESPKTSQCLPISPLEERRGDKRDSIHISGEGGSIKVDAPKNLKEVQDEANLRGILPEVSESFWDHYESTGWIDKNGHPIQNWRSKLRVWAKNERSRPAEEASKDVKAGPPKIKDAYWRYKSEYDTVTAELKAIFNGKAMDALGQIRLGCDEEKRVERLRKRKHELRGLLGL